MVKPSSQHPALTDATQRDHWLLHVQTTYGITHTEILKKACELSLQLGESITTDQGISAFYQGIEIADILLGLQVDTDTLAAGILASTARYCNLSSETLKEQLGDAVTKLVQGTIAMHPLDKIAHKNDANNYVNNVKKMMLAMMSDARVIVIKLAERVSIMRHLKKQNAAIQKKYAQETIDIYAPLANRLGIAQMKWELEDLSFALLEPETYTSIAKLLDEKRVDRDKRITDFKILLKQLLDKAGIQADISGRVKHIYSIYRKMYKKNIPYHEIYDTTAVRILVNKIEDCYAALGIVHATWDYLPEEFDDYISRPKENGYQSIHTVITGPQHKLIEVQIRTQDMHKASESGFAAHWVYKEGRTQTSVYEEKIARLRALLEWHKELTHGKTPLNTFHDVVFADQIYVFTPEGDIIDLPKGATPLDFAYSVHSSLGHRCRGAKVNDKMVPLTYKLSTGERVSILTTREGAPSRDWMNPELGYLVTSRARAKVAHWFKQLHHDEHIITGKQLLEREFAKHNIHEQNLEKIAQALHVKTPEHLYASISTGNIRLGQILSIIDKNITKKQKPESIIPAHKTKKLLTEKSRFSIEGVGDLLTSIAKCCKPIPGDSIVGYITVGRGITIHRKDCPNMANLNDVGEHRLIDVSWEKTEGEWYHTDIHIHATDRTGLIHDITSILSNHKVNVLGLNTRIHRAHNTADILITIETTGADMLGKIVTQISHIPNIITVKRNHTGQSAHQIR